MVQTWTPAKADTEPNGSPGGVELPPLPGTSTACKPTSGNPVSHDRVVQAAEAWLADSRAAWRPLPPVLRAAFDADTRWSRSRSACWIGLLGALVGFGFYPMIATIAPDVVHELNVMFLGAAVPVTVLSSLLVLLDLRPFWRELVLAVPSVFSASVITVLFIWSQAPITDLYVTGMILLLLFATVTIRLRFDVCAVVVAVIMALFGAGVARGSGLAPAYQQGLDLIGGGCAFYMLLANWRGNAEQARNYVLTLRERQRRQALTVQNVALVELAWSDALTGLANRRAYDLWLPTSWERARAAGEPLGLISIDVDHFKSYNDVYGHPAGDACLRRVAECLREQLRDTTDLVARIGGEEFAVILPRATPEICSQVARRLRAAVAMLELPHKAIGPGGVVTISCGCASGAESVQALCEAADTALYLAKQTGRNRVCVAGIQDVIKKEDVLF